MDPSRGRVPDCVKYGFLSSFLLTQAIPEDSVNWTVGGRFFDRRLELGGRLTWYSKYDNPQLDEFTDPDDCVGGCVLNIPFTWDEILIFDADRKSVGSGKSVYVRVELGGRRIFKKKTE